MSAVSATLHGGAVLPYSPVCIGSVTAAMWGGGGVAGRGRLGADTGAGHMMTRGRAAARLSQSSPQHNTLLLLLLLPLLRTQTTFHDIISY